MQHFIVFIQKLQLIINFLQVALLTLSMMSKLKKNIEMVNTGIFSKLFTPPPKKTTKLSKLY